MNNSNISEYLSIDDIEHINKSVQTYIIKYNLNTNEIINISLDKLKNNIYIYSYLLFIIHKYEYYVLNIYNKYLKCFKIYIIYVYSNNKKYKLDKYIDKKNNITVYYRQNNTVRIYNNNNNKFKIYNKLKLIIGNNFICRTYCRKTCILKSISFERFNIYCNFYYKNYKIYYISNLYLIRLIRKYKEQIIIDKTEMESYLSIYKLNFNIFYIF